MNPFHGVFLFIVWIQLEGGEVFSCVCVSVCVFLAGTNLQIVLYHGLLNYLRIVKTGKSTFSS